MRIELKVGDALTGLLIDGVAGTPYVSGTLHVGVDGSVTVEVPYVRHDDSDQFKHVDQWFTRRNPPRNLLMLTPVGRVSLFGISWGGHSEGELSIGRLRPAEVILHGRDGALQDQLTVTALRSELDGLNEWGRVSAIDTDYSFDRVNRVMGMTVTLSSSPVAVWRQGAAMMRIESNWSTSEHLTRGLAIADSLVLKSEFEDGPRSFEDHLAEQQKVASLLTILYGRRAAFRRHHIQDHRFVDYSLDGTKHGCPFVEIISTATIREQLREVPTRQQLAQPLALLPEVGEHGLEAWARNYERWKRFILPVYGSFRRTGAYLEDAVFSLGTAFEAAGALIGPRPGEPSTYGGNGKPTLLTLIYRCLDVVGIDFAPEVESPLTLARFIKNTYNTIKHPDRGDFPEYLVLYVARELGQLIARLLALHVLDSEGGTIDSYRSGPGPWRERQLLRDNRIVIAEDGSFTSTPG